MKDLAALGFAVALPIVHGYKNTIGGGLRLNFFDPLLLHNLNLSGRVHAQSLLRHERASSTACCG